MREARGRQSQAARRLSRVVGAMGATRAMGVTGTVAALRSSANGRVCIASRFGGAASPDVVGPRVALWPGNRGRVERRRHQIGYAPCLPPGAHPALAGAGSVRQDAGATPPPRPGWRSVLAYTWRNSSRARKRSDFTAARVVLSTSAISS